MKNVNINNPPNIGWLDCRLSDSEMEYVWRCIKNSKGNVKNKLAGNIYRSDGLLDRGDWFFNNVLVHLTEVYEKEYENLGSKYPTSCSHPFYLMDWWVNYQKQGEFNPLHNHGGVYSFVIWMKIPKDIEFKKQNKKDISAKSSCPRISAFEISYTDILGYCKQICYELTPKDEGLMLFFPAALCHQVYPFFDCDEERISVSGNIALNTMKRL